MCWLSGEPTLDEMLFDSTVITMMKRDGVAPDDPPSAPSGDEQALEASQGVPWPACSTNAPSAHRSSRARTPSRLTQGGCLGVFAWRSI